MYVFPCGEKQVADIRGGGVEGWRGWRRVEGWRRMEGVEEGEGGWRGGGG